jgi:hypothetical protein
MVLNFIPNIGKIFVIFIELYKKWTFVHNKGKKLLQKPGKKKATLECPILCVSNYLNLCRYFKGARSRFLDV